MKSGGNFFELLVYIGIGVVLVAILNLLMFINKKLNIELLDAVVQAMSRDDNISFTWIMIIVMVIMLWSDDMIAFWCILVCSFIMLFLETDRQLAIKQGKEPKSRDYSIFIFASMAGTFLISLFK